MAYDGYNWRDHETAESLAKRLRELGLEPFLDRWYLAAGQRWVPELERIMAECGSVAVLLGPHGMGPWQQRETELVLKRFIRLADEEGQSEVKAGRRGWSCRCRGAPVTRTWRPIRESCQRRLSSRRRPTAMGWYFPRGRGDEAQPEPPTGSADFR